MPPFSLKYNKLDEPLYHLRYYRGRHVIDGHSYIVQPPDYSKTALKRASKVITSMVLKLTSLTRGLKFTMLPKIMTLTCKR